MRVVGLFAVDECGGGGAGWLTVSALAPQVDARGLAELICRSGWPRHIGLDTQACQDMLTAYPDETARVDLPAETGTSHDPIKMRRLLRSLGLLFESLAIRDLRVYCDASDIAAPPHHPGPVDPGPVDDLCEKLSA